MRSTGNDSFPTSFRRGARGTTDIVADILFLCRTGKKKTGVMYQANLSHQMLKFYLWHMVQLRLLEESTDETFKTTIRGEEFLSYYQRMATIISGLGSGAAGIATETAHGISTRYVRNHKEIR